MSEETTAGSGTVLALAGRRIDANGANPARLPFTQVEAVRQRLRKLFVDERASAIVCSAACGANLVALEVAGKLGVRRRVVLPFSKDQFRETVVDRPGDWKDLYDSVIADVEAKGDLVVPQMAASDEAAYQAANEAIVREAETIDVPGERAAVIVWEGEPRPGSDATQAFRVLAARAGFSERVVPTL